MLDPCLQTLSDNQYRCTRDKDGTRYGWTITVLPQDLPIRCACPDGRNKITVGERPPPDPNAPPRVVAPKIDMTPEAKQGAEKLGITWEHARHYAKALYQWTKAGFPERTQEEVEQIEREICRPCEAYRDGRCKRCGCNVSLGPALVNKIRMATEHCPAKKWPGDK
jgi:hypothetical protein